MQTAGSCAQCRTDNFMDVEDGIKRPDLESSDSDGSWGHSVLYHPSSSLPRKAKELRRDFYREGSILEPPASVKDASMIPYSRHGTSQKKHRKMMFYIHRNLGPHYMQPNFQLSISILWNGNEWSHGQTTYFTAQGSLINNSM